MVLFMFLSATEGKKVIADVKYLNMSNLMIS